MESGLSNNNCNWWLPHIVQRQDKSLGVLICAVLLVEILSYSLLRMNPDPKCCLVLEDSCITGPKTTVSLAFIFWRLSSLRGISTECRRKKQGSRNQDVAVAPGIMQKAGLGGHKRSFWGWRKGSEIQLWLCNSVNITKITALYTIMSGYHAIQIELLKKKEEKGRPGTLASLPHCTPGKWQVVMEECSRGAGSKDFLAESRVHCPKVGTKAAISQPSSIHATSDHNYTSAMIRGDPRLEGPPIYFAGFASPRT